MPCVEHGVWQPCRLQQLRQFLRLVDRPRADQHGSAEGVQLLRLGDDPCKFLGLIHADHRRESLADRRPVGGHHGHRHVVGPREFGGTGRDRAGHPRQVRPAGEQILECDPRRMPGRHGDFDLFLRFDSLMEAIPPVAALGGAAGRFVDDHDLAVTDDILPVADEEPPRPRRPFDGIVDRQQARRLDRIGTLHGPHAAAAAAEQFAGLLLGLDLEILVGLELQGRLRGEAEERLLGGLGLAGGRRDDQRCARVVDEHVVGLVDQRKPIRPLQELGGAAWRFAGEHAAQVAAAFGDLAVHQAIFEEVEAKLARRAVGDIAGVGLAPCVEILLRLHDAHAQAEGLVDRCHPLGVAFGEVVVDRGKIGPAAGERVEHQWQRGHERLSFARLHLDDGTVHQRDASEQLHVVMPHAESPSARLASGGEALDQERIGRFARAGPVGERSAQPLEGQVVE